MNYFDLINNRESCRDYAAKSVEKEKLVKCIEAARVAPSACNSQPWSFIVVNSLLVSPQVAKCLQDAGMNKFTDQCPAFIVVIEEKATLSARIGGLVKSQSYAPIDIGIVTAHICLAATAQGLSTCIMGWINEGKLKELLEIPQSKRIRLVIGVGYATSDTIREKKRKSIEEIAKFVD